ncbi:MAG: MerR family transcriptional regulator [Actinomycetota bacterium]|nr:MerR family transcriptional regulator [Actinomycetota bacterium]
MRREGQRNETGAAASSETVTVEPAVSAEAGSDHELDGLLKIGAVAARLGISERTLRYYEEVGLLRPHLHHPGASRRYCDADVERIQRIRELQGLMGFNLEEIRRIVAAEDRLRLLRERFYEGGDDDQRRIHEEAGEVLLDLRAQVEAKIGLLSGFLEQLDARIRRHQDRSSVKEPSVAEQCEQQPAARSGPPEL